MAAVPDVSVAVASLPPDRLRHAQSACAALRLDALLLTPGADLQYLTGYAPPPLERLTCLVLPRQGNPVVVVPRLELPAAGSSPSAGWLRIDSYGETEDAFGLAAALLRDTLGGEPNRVGLADRMWAEQVLRFRAALPHAEQSLAGDVLRPLRVRKTPAEVEALRRAARAIDQVHRGISEWLRPGRTERQVARDVGEAILAAGHVAANFVIVAAGPNGASPHHDPTDDLIRPGDPVVVDIGGTMPDGYCSDATRTYVVGEPVPVGFAEHYAVLQQAQAAACEAVGPGVSAAVIDAAARDVLAAAGLGEHFLHRTGHGIGLAEHEEPWIVAGNATPLESGMCFSVEPGIYLAGQYGARIEDIVAVTERGVERLNLLPRDLVVLAG